MDATRQHMLLLLAVAALVITGAWLLGIPLQQAAPKHATSTGLDREIADRAIAACDKAVKDQLINPRSYSPEAAKILPESNNWDHVAIMREFYATNGFGATIRQHYSARWTTPP